MSDRSDALIAALSSDLRPVRRLRSPTLRAAAWLGIVAATAVLLLPMVRLDALEYRLQTLPDLAWATAGATLTAIAAAVAAFQASVPGRSPFWAALPVPPAILWLAASGWGCLREDVVLGLAPATMRDAAGCATFITLVSMPLSLILLLMVRRACPLWPGRVAALGGLAAAAAAASLLTLFHPHDTSLIDLLMHLAAISFVVVTTRRAA